MDKTDPKVIDISKALNAELSKAEKFNRIPPMYGVHDGIPFWDYLTWDAYGSGEVRGIVNPAKFRHERIVGKDAKSIMTQGRGLHACVLEPDTEWLRFHRLQDGKDRRNKEYTVAKEEYGADFVLTAREYDACLGQRDSLYAHSRISKLLEDGRPEVTFAWEDSETGLPLKGRSDWLAERFRTTFDLKSTGDAREEMFSKVARNFGYPVQGIHYETGLRHHGLDIKHYTIIATEPDPPYLPILYTISTKDMMIAEAHWRALVDRLAHCIETEEWPGYPEHTHVLHMGQWWEARVQEEVAMLEEAIQ